MVSDTGEQLGIIPVQEALDMAIGKGIDLVEVAPSAKPPVCRLMDFGKFKFEQGKREKEARKKQKVISLKEIKMRPNIEDHDIGTKARHARKFLEAGDKVKVTIMFRGRQITHPEIAEKLSYKFANVLSDVSTIDKKPRVEGRNMIMFLVPSTDSDKKEEA